MTEGRRRNRQSRGPNVKHRATHLSELTYTKACEMARFDGISYSALVAKLIDQEHQRRAFEKEEWDDDEE